MFSHLKVVTLRFVQFIDENDNLKAREKVVADDSVINGTVLPRKQKMTRVHWQGMHTRVWVGDSLC